MMYHHYLLTLDKEETIRNIYEKQQPNKVDWYKLLKSDFEFVEKEISEDEIQSLSKIEYKKIVIELIQQAVFLILPDEKCQHTKHTKRVCIFGCVQINGTGTSRDVQVDVHPN